jgi:hypothetical protein
LDANAGTPALGAAKIAAQTGFYMERAYVQALADMTGGFSPAQELVQQQRGIAATVIAALHGQNVHLFSLLNF